MQENKTYQQMKEEWMADGAKNINDSQNVNVVLDIVKKYQNLINIIAATISNMSVEEAFQHGFLAARTVNIGSNNNQFQKTNLFNINLYQFKHSQDYRSNNPFNANTFAQARFYTLPLTLEIIG